MQACPNALADEIHCNEHNASNESGHTRKQDCIYDDSDHLPNPLSAAPAARFPIFSWLTSGKTILDDITQCAGRKSASMARLP
jgi:hypothetical protein